MKPIRYVPAITAVLICTLFVCSASADDWKLRKNKKGIQVFTRTIPGSGFKEFKATVEVEAGLDNVLKLMEDIPSYPQWFPKLKEAKLIKIISSTEMILYQMMKLPFPADDRDTVFKVSASRDSANGAVTLKLTSLGDYLPERKGVIRVKQISGSWTFIPDAAKSTVQVIYQMHSEPGGRLPSWIANAAVVKRPFEVLNNMRDMLKKSRYRTVEPGELQLFR